MEAAAAYAQQERAAALAAPAATKDAIAMLDTDGDGVVRSLQATHS